MYLPHEIENAYLGQTVPPFDSIGKSPTIDRTASDFDSTHKKLKKSNTDIARYIPATLQLIFQGMIDRVDTIEQPVHISYKDLETFDFQLLLDQTLYTNLNSLHLLSQ